jgi:hypothetical protein
VKVRGEDARRADLLEDICLKLRERELLPTSAAVRSFAHAMGSKQATSSRRDQAIIELMNLLIQLPGSALDERMRQTVVTDRKLGQGVRGVGAAYPWAGFGRSGGINTSRLACSDFRRLDACPL